MKEVSMFKKSLILYLLKSLASSKLLVSLGVSPQILSAKWRNESLCQADVCIHRRQGETLQLPAAKPHPFGTSGWNNVSNAPLSFSIFCLEGKFRLAQSSRHALNSRRNTTADTEKPFSATSAARKLNQIIISVSSDRKNSKKEGEE